MTRVTAPELLDRRGRILAEVAALTCADRRADAIAVLTRALSGGFDVTLLRELVSLERQQGMSSQLVSR